MGTISIVIICIVVFGLGAAVGAMALLSGKAKIATRLEESERKLSEADGTISENRDKIARLTAEKIALVAENSNLGTRLKETQDRANQEVERSLKEKSALKDELLQSNRAALEDKERVCAERLETQEKRHREALEAQQKRFDETMAKVSEQMKNATDQMLKDRQKEFEHASSSNLGQIVDPLKESIEKMKKAMDENKTNQTAISSAMKENLESVMKHTVAAKESADELARVFKHQSKVQGDWGETVLLELLESQGLTNGVHFHTQDTMKDSNGNVIKSDDGKMMRPDVILHLDKRREVIIDSKVSLTAFMDYVNAENEDERQRALKAHLESIQKHVKELSVKDYSKYIQSPKVKMDYVIMFVPHTGALLTAMNMQPDLWRKAMEKNVYIADEQTLFAALKIINMTWTQIMQTQNHEEVFKLANEMLERVGQFAKKYDLVGKSLRSALDDYEEGAKKLTDGRQSIVKTCNKLMERGAKQNVNNPLPEIQDVDEIEKI